ncbi:unnamed protein product [Dibothriocephalus latus]|uniref:Uncharacterized protein n=1 Tax=Dibothriocephalus latus TaxID=60516 RepID=A0A3P6ULG1_DIBLA|nr:unnamed protein product [Dibothriocephalus latus]
MCTSPPARKISDSSVIPDYNIILMGSHGVGKSALARKFLKNSFSESYQPTVEEMYSTILQTITGSCKRLVLTDTAGLHHFPAMRELRMRTGDAFLLVFSFDSLESFKEALRLHKKLKQVRGKCISDQFDDQAVIFIGNKLDLLFSSSVGNKPPENDRIKREEHRKQHGEDSGLAVAEMAANIYQEAEDTFSQKPNFRYITTSARIGHNVLELFHLVLWPIVHASTQQKPIYEGRKYGSAEDSSMTRKISAGNIFPKRIPFEIHFPLRQRIPLAQTTVESNISVDDIPSVHVSVPETDNEPKTLFRSSIGSRRKYSISLRLLPSISSKHRRKQTEDLMNKPAIRSRSVDNSALKKIKSHDGLKDLNAAFSILNESGNSSVSIHCMSEDSNINTRSASFCSGVPFAFSNSKYGNFLSPGQISDGCSSRGSMEIPTQALDFVKEVGRLLDPSNKSANVADFRIPHTPFVGGQSKSPGSAWERIRKKGVFY